MKRGMLPLALAAALIIGLVVYLRQGRSGVAGFQTVTVTRGPITQAVTATGTLNPVVNVQVGSQVSGIIQKLAADFNSNVNAGEVIAQIDPATFQATVMQAEGDLANAEAQLELARLNANRTQALFAKQNSAQADVDQSTASLHQAEATVKIKQGALAKAKTDLERCRITSPIDGTVISRNVDVGQTVAASLQAPILFTIANDLTKMQIDANVAEADVGAVAIDQDVDFTVDAFPNQTFRGRVTQVRNAPITVQNVVTYDTVIGVSNPELKLKPGMTANVSIIIAHQDEALKIANAALRYRPPEAANASPRGPGGPRREGGGERAVRPGVASRDRRPERTVYRLAGEKPEPVQIKTGISDGVATEVLEGLNENDRVVTALLGANANPAQPSANPFGGGARRGF